MSDNEAQAEQTQTQAQTDKLHLIEQAKVQRLNYLKDIVMRQTDYNEEQTFEKLKQHNNDITAIVREFLGATTKKNKETTNTSVNQQIYSEIRCLMDTAAANYKARKEAEELQQKRQQMYIEQARRELERRSKLTTDNVLTTSFDESTTTKL